jgi:hypothetical protein
MRASIAQIHGLNDFVPGWYSVPQNPVVMVRRGTGDFVRGQFSVPDNPVMKGMGHVGCGSDCGCGPCRAGMGAIDFSLTTPGITTAIGTSLGITSMPAIPNWIVYAAGIAVVYGIYSQSGRRRR